MKQVNAISGIYNHEYWIREEIRDTIILEQQAGDRSESQTVTLDIKYLGINLKTIKTYNLI